MSDVALVDDLLRCIQQLDESSSSRSARAVIEAALSGRRSHPRAVRVLPKASRCSAGIIGAGGREVATSGRVLLRYSRSVSEINQRGWTAPKKASPCDEANPLERNHRSPLVSVIIPTYNGEAFLEDAIDSVLGQTYSPMECVVVDDGSTDRTPAVIEAYRGSVRGERQANQGFARARNRGATLAVGDLLSFLDHDDWWRPTKVERQVHALIENPGVAVVYTAVELTDECGNHLSTIPAPPQGRAFENTILMEWPHMALEQGALIRRGAFFELGGFDERLTTSIGCDLACRLALAYPVAPVDEPLVAYRQHPDQMHHDLSALERDMRAIFGKVLGSDDRYRPLVRRAQYNLDVCLTHWYWRERRQPLHAVWHAARATIARPRHVVARLTRHGQEPAPKPRLPSYRR